MQKSSFRFRVATLVGVSLAVSGLVFSQSLLGPATDTRTLRSGSAAGDRAGADMGRPLLGFVARSSPVELRAILGVPGAAVFSDALLTPSDATTVRIAPGRPYAGPYAWIERSGGAPSILALSGTRAGNASPLPGALPRADLVAFSPLGNSVALFSAASHRLQVIAGLPDAPKITQDLDAALLPGPPDSLAVSDDASAVLLASGRAAYLLSPSGQTRLILNLSASAALAFFPNSAAAAIADRGAGSVYLMHNSAGDISSGLLAAGLDGLQDIASTTDAASLVLTNPSANRIWTVSAQTGEVRSFDSRISAAALSRIGDGDTFLIASEPGQPAWIFVPEGADGHTVLVPAAPPARPRRD
ncbi:MAG TPA: hypothetical protein VN841_15200 [Bryobacteraceae bacterium]|nr:hypothetical protein [Bryobacteraceae bacterium]